MKNNFFSLAEMKQPVNQWLCIAFVGIWCFWIVLYYSVSNAFSVGNSITADIDSSYRK